MKPTSTCPRCGAPVGADSFCPRCEFAVALEPPQPATPLPTQATELTLRRFGDYELLEELGHGGMGVVYKARHLKLNRLVALKLLLLGQFSSEPAVKRFQREAQAVAALRHPNIVGLHDVGELDGQHYLTMELVEGRSLAALLRAGPLPPRQAAAYCRAMAQAMSAAHTAGIIHRDLKPANVLIDPFDQPRITDFGLAKRLDGDGDITLTGHVLGSPNYLAPELAAGREKECGPGTDIFSMGAILYECLTGRPPFLATTLQETLLRIRDSEPVAPRVLNPKFPRDLETICLKCLEKEPAKRYASAQQLADELDRFLKDEPIHARPIGPTARLWRWGRRKPAIASLGAATILLLLAVAIISTSAAFRINRERQRADQNFYDSDMNLAQHSWDDGDLGKTLGLLRAHQPRAGEPDRRGFEWFYFWNLCQGDQRMTLTNHSGVVNCVAFSPNGKLLATGSVGDPVQIWETATGNRVKTFAEQNVVSLAFAPDGQTLGVGGRDKVVVWNLETGREVFKQEDPLGQFRIAFSAQGTSLVIGKQGGPRNLDGGSAELWDYVTRERKQIFSESGGYVALSPRGDRLATGNWRNSIKIWDLASGLVVGKLKPAGVIAMAFSPDGLTLATAHWGPEVNLWDVTRGHRIGSLTNNEHKVWSLAFSPDGKFLATAGADQTVSFWDVATCEQTEQFRGHSSEVMTVAFSADGQTLASGSKDNTTMLWSVDPHRALTTVSNVISRPVFSRNGRLLAAGIGQNKVAAWDVATLQVKGVFADAHDAVAFSADGSALMTLGTNYFMKMFDVATQVAGETISGGRAEDLPSYADFSPNGKTLVAGFGDGTLKFFDAKTGALIGTKVHAHADNIFKLAVSPNGKLVATAGRDAEAGRVPAAKIWDLATHERIAALTAHTDTVLSVGFSADGKTLATCGGDTSIKFWETTTWKQILPSLRQKEAVTSVAFSPDGKTLASTSADGTMKLWNVATRRELTSLKLDFPVMHITFSPDGQTLAGWGYGHELQLWRAPVPDKKPARPRGD